MIYLNNLGQYLRPTKHHLSVVSYISPEMFDWYRIQAESFGFKYVASGPLIRSSYRAGEFYMDHLIRSGKTNGTKTISKE
jgi:lipoic acid synthetase